ncbi:MAG: 4-hydroxybutyrate CoA-transferase, partial [Muribaculum sp.]|nr:4-hydroxybutyrate CoA-transferase [Muribaculum sp.]
ICADSIGTKIFSGVGGQQDFVQGAARSEGGASFTAMLSTTPRGVNKIKPILTHGAGIVTTRFQAHYVVTEYGIANLSGCSLPERARKLVSLAAPQFREELDRAAAERFGYSYLRLKEYSMS